MVTNITPKMGGSPFASAENAVANLEGWTELSATFTYTSADDPSFVLGTSDGDLYYLSPGWRVRLKQGGGYKYFIVTRVTYGGGSTSLTLYGGIDYDLENLEITHFAISNVKAPSGFPLDPEKWTVEVTDTGDRSQASPVVNTWYNLHSSHQITIPVGVWHVSYNAYMSGTTSGSQYSWGSYLTLSTVNNTESDASMTEGFGFATFSVLFIPGTALQARKTISVSSKTIYYLNARTIATVTGIGIYGAYQPTIIRAVCAYL